ncbi:selenium cofactor biosynthesis protein YqeC [Halorubrum vacuolatum]|uniref:Probable selenium-dependent hydroxylase accessory protein YqeC n=1 Tax=Halorubrum vacuolatum TaxID=63740 RepID=A0A238WUX9_HALVU|nr:selenium cofactor biosynthesis protein YqeC [Halorubrum vacuolatum]SNR50332.1 probable selenium-dependent hydroxylase accessory protein YqeC [Halorubrum vacuolatum]
MDLVQAFRATDAALAVVGAGGKKTTLYALADRLDGAVVTATVRIPIFDHAVDAVRVTPDPVTAAREAFVDGDGLVEETAGSGPIPADGSLGLVPERERSDRYRGYDVTGVDDLIAAHDGPVLIKADGARLREFKAPNEREPQIPSRTDVVVPIVSANVVGEPLDEAVVHRPERVVSVARAAGLDVSLGDPITAELVGTVLASPDGGLRGVPEGAVAIPLCNKVDDDERAETARAIATTFRRRYDALATDSTDASRVSVPHVVLGRLIDGTVVDVVPVQG